MDKISEFDREYFIQTRKEIDTEKRERDQILNFAVVVLGALGFAFVQTEKAHEFLKHFHSVLFEISALVIINSLFWVRWMKLRQIADRWYTLYHLLIRYFGESKSNEYMEIVVIDGFEKARYLRKDVFLCFALSLPIYSLILITIFNQPICFTWQIVSVIIIISLHVIVTLLLLRMKFIDPYKRDKGNNETPLNKGIE